MTTYVHEGLAALASGLVLSPFTRTRRLLADIPPGMPPLDLTIGEPREQMPGFLVEKVEAAKATFAKYPPIRGSDELRKSIATWLGRRFNLGVDACRSSDKPSVVQPLVLNRRGSIDELISGRFSVAK